MLFIRIHLKKGCFEFQYREGVNVCIHDFDDVKEESNKAASKDKHLLQE